MVLSFLGMSVIGRAQQSGKAITPLWVCLQLAFNVVDHTPEVGA